MKVYITASRPDFFPSGSEGGGPTQLGHELLKRCFFGGSKVTPNAAASRKKHPTTTVVLFFLLRLGVGVGKGVGGGGVCTNATTGVKYSRGEGNYLQPHYFLKT